MGTVSKWSGTVHWHCQVRFFSPLYFVISWHIHNTINLNDLLLKKEPKWLHLPKHKFCLKRTQASDKEWVQLQGKFLLNGVASRAILFIEGPNPGIDILVDSIVVKRPIKAGSSVPPIIEVGITLHKQWYFQENYKFILNLWMQRFLLTIYYLMMLYC